MYIYVYVHAYTQTYTHFLLWLQEKKFPRKDLRVINHLQIVTDVYIILSKRFQDF